MAGLTVNGFEKLTLAEIKREIEDRYRNIFGPQINFVAPSVFSQLVGTSAERESKIWDVLEEIYNSQSPSSASDTQLDKVSSVTGVTRLGALASEVRGVHLFGEVGTIVPAGTQFSVLGSPNSIFTTTNPGTLAAGADEVQTLTLSAVPTDGYAKFKFRDEETAQIPWNSTADQIRDFFLALNKILPGFTVTGTFATSVVFGFGGENGKINQPLISVSENTLTDASVNPVALVVSQTTPGEAQATVDAKADQTGPIVAPAYSLTQIETPVSGLDRVLNPEDGILGRNIETDAEFRQRRIQSLQRSGSATVDAIRAKLLELPGVQEALVFENVTMSVDGLGLPPKSFRAYVQGGDNNEIAAAIWASKPGGIESDGSIAVSTPDSNNLPHVVNFSRSDEVQIYFAVEVEIDPLIYPPNGDVTIQNLIKDYINSLQIGEDVILYPKVMALLNPIPGILSVQMGVAKFYNPPLNNLNKIIIDAQEIARLDDPDQIVVTHA